MKHLQKIVAIISVVVFQIMDSTVLAMDVDVDGMSEVWQRLHTIASGDQSSDLDGDGQTNGIEAAAGTNPRNPNDVFRVESLDFAEDLSEVTLVWRSFPALFYSVQMSENLQDWSLVGSVLGHSGASQTSFSLTLSSPSLPKAFFRVLADANSSPDTDGDGLQDWEEHLLQTSIYITDTDGDGIPDGAEFSYGLNPLLAEDAALDADSDGQSNGQEYQNGTNPQSSLSKMPSPAVRYAVIDCGEGVAIDLNDSGHVLVWSGSPRQYLFAEGDRVGLSNEYPACVGNDGTVAGPSQFDGNGGGRKGFLENSGSSFYGFYNDWIKDEPGPCWINDISSLGIQVGSIMDDGSHPYPCYYLQGGQAILLNTPTVQSGNQSFRGGGYASAIHEGGPNGQIVVGMLFDFSIGDFVPAMWLNGSYTLMQNSYESAYLSGVNMFKQAVGSGGSQALLWDNGQKPLGHGKAWGINSRQKDGQSRPLIVGGDGGHHEKDGLGSDDKGVFWEQPVLEDGSLDSHFEAYYFDDVIVDKRTWNINTAVAVNEACQVAASATNLQTGKTHAVLLLPIEVTDFKAEDYGTGIETSGVYRKVNLQPGDVVVWGRSLVSAIVKVPNGFSNTIIEPRIVQDVTPNRTRNFTTPTSQGHTKEIMQYQNQKVLDNVLDESWVELITIRRLAQDVLIESRDQPEQGGGPEHSGIIIADKFDAYLQCNVFGQGWSTYGKVEWRFNANLSRSGSSWTGSAAIRVEAGV